VALAYFVYPLQALWLSCSPPSDIGGLSLFCLSSSGRRARKPKGLKRIIKIGYGHICLMEENKKTKGPEEDSQNRLRSPMSEGGEEENQRPLLPQT
jgi:hypothetical protein